MQPGWAALLTNHAPERLTAEDVDMQMRHFLPAMPARIGDGAIPRPARAKARPDQGADRSGGAVEIELPGSARNVMGEHKHIPLTRIHLEEDVGKLNHGATDSLVDYNRAGTPLMEIVSEPDIDSAEEAFAYLTSLRQILIYGGVSDADIGAALKEALAQGASNAVSQLGRSDGFWQDTRFRIPLPKALRKADPLLRGFGAGPQLDELHLSMNRAAEAAVPVAAEVFSGAIRSLSLKDVRAILDGPPDAATRYFQQSTSASLQAKFQPIVAGITAQAGLANFAGFKAWLSVSTTSTIAVLVASTLAGLSTRNPDDLFAAAFTLRGRDLEVHDIV